jgi:hypothetical protein
MQITNWNIERYEPKKQEAIKQLIIEQNADLIILTETSKKLEFDGFTRYSTKSLPKYYDGQEYRDDEVRASIYSKWECVEKISTYDDYTSLCYSFNTPIGNITIYAGIIGSIGVIGDARPIFDKDLAGQLADWQRIFKPKNNIILAGDFNITLGSHPWPSALIKNTILNAVNPFNLEILTKEPYGNVDHIIVSKSLVQKKFMPPIIFNKSLKLSDHIGITIDI